MGVNLLKSRASNECERSHRIDAIGDINLRKGGAVQKSSSPYLLDCFGNMHLGKFCASIKCVISNIGHALPYDHPFNGIL